MRNINTSHIAHLYGYGKPKILLEGAGLLKNLKAKAPVLVLYSGGKLHRFEGSLPSEAGLQEQVGSCGV